LIKEQNKYDALASPSHPSQNGSDTSSLKSSQVFLDLLNNSWQTSWWVI